MVEREISPRFTTVGKKGGDRGSLIFSLFQLAKKPKEQVFGPFSVAKTDTGHATQAVGDFVSKKSQLFQEWKMMNPQPAPAPPKIELNRFNSMSGGGSGIGAAASGTLLPQREALRSETAPRAYPQSFNVEKAPTTTNHNLSKFSQNAAG